MNTRHAVIEGPLGDLTLVADGDALIGLYFRHHWYRPSAFTFGTRVDADSDGLLGETRAQEVSARSRGARRVAGGSTLLMAATNGHKRVDSADWGAVAAELNDFGGALLPQLITKPEAANLRRLYSDDGLFRDDRDGEYRYLERPYPEPIEELKQALYPDCCRSPGIGGASWAVQPHGLTTSMIGSTCAMPPDRPGRRRSRSSMPRATGMRCTETCTGT